MLFKIAWFLHLLLPTQGWGPTVAEQNDWTLRSAQTTLRIDAELPQRQVENIFAFGLQAQSSKKLLLEMYDQRNLQQVAHNYIRVAAGPNYRALDLSTLQDGNYWFRLSDGEQEMLCEIIITKPEF